MSERLFKLGDRVTKTKGSSWTGHVVGFYSTSLTPIGYAVESENEPGSVQIYPESALSSAGDKEIDPKRWREHIGNIDGLVSSHPTSADKLEVVERQWRGRMSGSKWSDWQKLNVEPNPIFEHVEYRNLTIHSDATHIITEQAERIAGLERERDEAMDWASNWHGQCQAVATILGLPEPEGIGHAEAVRDKFKAAEADRGRMKEIIGLFDAACVNTTYPEDHVVWQAFAKLRALNGGAEK